MADGEARHGPGEGRSADGGTGGAVEPCGTHVPGEAMDTEPEAPEAVGPVPVPVPVPEPGREPQQQPQPDSEPYDGGLLPAFVARLREAGLDPDAEQLCDALWLARWTRHPDEPDDEDDAATPLLSVGPAQPGRPAGRPAPQVTGRDEAPDPAPVDDEPAEQRDLGDADRRIALYPVPRTAPTGGSRPDGPAGRGRSAARGGRARALTVGVPAAPALPAPLELQRALRPLQRYRPAAPPLRRTLDETATAELSARVGGLIMPVFRGASRGEALLQCVMDASSSMLVWHRMFSELQQIFGQLGAFRDVQVRYLHQGPDGAAAVSRSPDPAAAPLNSADRLSDPTGRRVTVLVSDCAGPLWHSGRAHRLLHQLAGQAPAAVLQPLPQRMWNRTRLPVTYGSLSRGEGPGGAAVLKVMEHAGTGPAMHPGALAIPVLPPVEGALAAWARLLSGTGAGRISGAVGWVRADQPAAAAQRPATGCPRSNWSAASVPRPPRSPDSWPSTSRRPRCICP